MTCTNPDCPCPDCIEFKADQNNDYSEEERRRIKAMCGTKRIRAKIARKKIVIKRFQRRNEIYDLNRWRLYQRDGMTEAVARELDRQDGPARAEREARIIANVRRAARERQQPKKGRPTEE